MEKDSNAFPLEPPCQAAACFLQMWDCPSESIHGTRSSDTRGQSRTEELISVCRKLHIQRGWRYQRTPTALNRNRLRSTRTESMAFLGNCPNSNHDSCSFD